MFYALRQKQLPHMTTSQAGRLYRMDAHMEVLCVVGGHLGGGDDSWVPSTSSWS